jgi:phage terminase small subunit
MTTRKTSPAAKKAPGKTTPAKPRKAGASQDATELRKSAFVEAYIANGGNATEAAISAGYSANTARQAGSRLLTQVDIKQQVANRRAELADRYRLTSDRVLEQLGKIVYADVRKAFDKSGNLLAVQDMPDEVAHAITSIEVETMPGKGQDVDGTGMRWIGRTVKVKFADKGAAIDKAMKHLGLFKADNQQRNPFERMTPEELDKFIAAQEKRIAAAGKV